MNDSLLISPDELAQALERPDSESAVLPVDTRGAADFAKGHIPGAVNLPSGDLYDPATPTSDLLPKEAVEKRVSEAGIDNDTQLVLYDDSGLVPSARVFWALENYGRGKMALLDGGFLSWMSRRLPLETAEEGKFDSGTSQPASASRNPHAAGGFAAQSDGAAFASRDDVVAALEDGNTLLIDTRTEDEYFGRTKAHTHNGHIPGAKNIDWQKHITDLFNPTLKPPEELQRLYEEAGLSRDKRAIVYCRTGSRSAHTYFVLRYLGYTDVRNYKGSWMEWNEDASLPIER